MDPVASANESHLKTEETRTLGDLLYASPIHRPIAEADWLHLVESVAAGNHHALLSIYQGCYRIVFTLMVRICKNRTTAEELTVNVFHDIWLTASQYNPSKETSVIGWIMNKARAKAINRLRLQVRTSNPAARAQLHRLSRDVAAGFLKQLLPRLSPEERDAIETAFFLELNYLQVADRLGQPPDVIRTRIRSGMRKLRVAFAEAMKSA